MFRSLIYLLITSIFIAFRKNVIVKQYPDHNQYSQTYDVPAISAQYIIHVSETLVVIDYRFWFIPKIKRYIYRADLKYLIDGVLDKEYIQHYPRLVLGRVMDPIYPLVVVSSTHMENFLTKEQNL